MEGESIAPSVSPTVTAGAKKGLHFFISRENVQNGEIQDGRQCI